VSSFNSCKDKRKNMLTVGCTRQMAAGCPPHPVRLIGGKSSPACVSYALQKLAEIHASSETVLIAKRRFDVDDSWKSENNVDEVTQTVNDDCFCDPSAVGYGAVCYPCLVLVCGFAIRCSFVFERPRVACRLEFCAVTIAFKLPQLAARLATKQLELTRSVKKIVRYLCSLLLQQRRMGNDLLATCECETLF